MNKLPLVLESMINEMKTEMEVADKFKIVLKEMNDKVHHEWDDDQWESGIPCHTIDIKGGRSQYSNEDNRDLHVFKSLYIDNEIITDYFKYITYNFSKDKIKHGLIEITTFYIDGEEVDHNTDEVRELFFKQYDIYKHKF